jgi:anti-anti-sigma factor
VRSLGVGLARVRGGEEVEQVAAVETLADGTPLVSVWGKVDLATSPRLASVLEEAAAGDRDVHVEFSQDSFIDSTGLGVLIKIAQQLRVSGFSGRERCLDRRGQELRPG